MKIIKQLSAILALAALLAYGLPLGAKTGNLGSQTQAEPVLAGFKQSAVKKASAAFGPIKVISASAAPSAVKLSSGSACFGSSFSENLLQGGGIINLNQASTCFNLNAKVSALPSSAQENLEVLNVFKSKPAVVVARKSFFQNRLNQPYSQPNLPVLPVLPFGALLALTILFTVNFRPKNPVRPLSLRKADFGFYGLCVMRC